MPLVIRSAKWRLRPYITILATIAIKYHEPINIGREAVIRIEVIWNCILDFKLDIVSCMGESISDTKLIVEFSKIIQ